MPPIAVPLSPTLGSAISSSIAAGNPASAMGGPILGLAQQALDSAWAARFGPDQQVWHYAGYAAKPVVIPQPGDLITAIQIATDPDVQGRLTHLLRMHGITTGAGGVGGAGDDHYSMSSMAWQHVIRARRTVVSPDQAIALEILDRGLPPLSNPMTEARRDQILRQYGWWESRDRADLMRMRSLPTPVDVFTLLNREVISEERAKRILEAQGYRHPQERDWILSLRQQFPGPSDLVRFAVREGWDDAIAQLWGYDDEFSSTFDYWMRQNGYYGNARKPGDPGPPLTWAQLYHRVSWDVPSPTMAYEMVHRLRPARMDRVRRQLQEYGADPATIAALQPFQFRELESVLKVADYPTRARAWLAAISSLMLTRTDIKRMIRLGLMDRREAEEQYVDRGYVREDAKRLVEFEETESRVSRFSKVRGETKARILATYQAGILDRNAAAIALYRAGLTDPQAVTAYRTLPVFTQEQLALGGIPELRVGAILLRSAGDVGHELAIVDADAQLALTKKAIAAVRKCFLRGITPRSRVPIDLSRIGVLPAAQTRYIELWELENDCDRKLLTSAKTQRLYRYGLITRDQAIERLRNLGYSISDASLLASETVRDQLLDTAKAQLAAARTAQEQQRALQAAIKAAQQQLDRFRRDLARSGSPAQLAKWIVRGLITPAEVNRRLIALGWPDVDADRLIAQALQDAAAARPRPIPPPPQPVGP